MLPLTVSSLMRSQEEQFFINGNLPEFHLVDIPDIWIGLSGSQHAILVLFPLSLSPKMASFINSLSPLFTRQGPRRPLQMGGQDRSHVLQLRSRLAQEHSQHVGLWADLHR